MADFTNFKKDLGLGEQKLGAMERIRKEKIEYNPAQSSLVHTAVN